jgi:hypothetical protein
MSAMPRLGARHGGGGPRRGPRDDEAGLPDEWWEQFEEGFRFYTRGGWRAGPEAAPQL